MSTKFKLWNPISQGVGPVVEKCGTSFVKVFKVRFGAMAIGRCAGVGELEELSSGFIVISRKVVHFRAGISTNQMSSPRWS